MTYFYDLKQGNAREFLIELVKKFQELLQEYELEDYIIPMMISPFEQFTLDKFVKG